jgi:uncharacterized protein (TIGR04255 family)
VERIEKPIMQFSQPPLIELIAEFRWAPSGATSANQAVPTAVFLSAREEEFFARIADRVSEWGFSASERVVPSGFLVPPFQVVYRFRRPQKKGEHYLYQVGPGVFTANALPPYKNWNAFRPIVQDGINLLIDLRDDSEKNAEFINVSLRYIDLFPPDLTEGQPMLAFLTDTLGIGLDLPSVLSDQAALQKDIQPQVQLNIPLRTGLNMSLTIANGVAGGKPGVVMDTTVQAAHPTASNSAAVMETLESAHSSIRQTFLGLTKRLHAKMEPTSEADTP